MDSKPIDLEALKELKAIIDAVPFEIPKNCTAEEADGVVYVRDESGTLRMFMPLEDWLGLVEYANRE